MILFLAGECFDQRVNAMQHVTRFALESDFWRLLWWDVDAHLSTAFRDVDLHLASYLQQADILISEWIKETVRSCPEIYAKDKPVVGVVVLGREALALPNTLEMIRYVRKRRQAAVVTVEVNPWTLSMSCNNVTDRIGRGDISAFSPRVWRAEMVRKGRLFRAFNEYMGENFKHSDYVISREQYKKSFYGGSGKSLIDDCLSALPWF